MKRNTLFALLSVIGIFLLPQASHAQGLGNYGFATGVDSTKWVDISSARDMLGCSDDDALASELKVIGFSFPFGSSSYTSYSVNTDGNLRLGSNVTGTGYSTPPFSSLNADYNSPKINAFGCDGYGTSLHYVKSSTILTPSNELMLVVEFCLGTNSIISRYNLYKWQVHLFPNGNIDIVFPPADQLPAAPPDVSHQCGICTNSFDGWVISSSNNPYTWFDANRYYSFIHYNNFTCPAPTGVTASNITTDSATISWTAGGNEILWQLEVGGNVYYTTTTTFSVGNLDANTDYTASVRAICAASDTSLAAPCYFHTDCSPLSILPYSNGFENYPYYPATNLVEALPFCWHRYNDASGSSTYSPYVVSNDNYAHSGQNGLYWHHVSTSSSARNQYAILPPVDLNQYDISDLTLAFYAKTDFIGNLALPVVGVMDSPTDTASFTPVHFLSDTEVGNEWQLVTVPLSNYAGTGSYIAIKWHNPGSACSFAIDDIMLTDSWCSPPMNVTASVSSDSLTVSWERNGGSSFSVVLGNDTVNAVTDTFYTFSNLAGNTIYSYAVATECTSSHGMYVAGNIRTLCSALDVLPFAEL